LLLGRASCGNRAGANARQTGHTNIPSADENASVSGITGR
jgi:hypothetical protein